MAYTCRDVDDHSGVHGVPCRRDVIFATTRRDTSPMDQPYTTIRYARPLMQHDELRRAVPPPVAYR